MDARVRSRRWFVFKSHCGISPSVFIRLIRKQDATRSFRAHIAQAVVHFTSPSISVW